MNQIRAIQALNKKEIENGISPEASWHTDYRDTAFVYFGGLPYEFSEGDIITIFSQYGEPVFLKLVRDKESGKSKGFGWLKYEDQRSTDLVVDNLGGATIGGRMIRVDHARYKPRDDEDLDECKVGWEDLQRKAGKVTEEEIGTNEEADDVPDIPEQRELKRLIAEHDDDDPMKAYLVEEKQKEVAEALARLSKDNRRERHRHSHRSHRSGRQDEEEESDRRKRARTDESTERRSRDRAAKHYERDRKWDDDRAHRKHREGRAEDEHKRRHRDRDYEDRERHRDRERQREGRGEERYDQHDRDRRRRREPRDRDIKMGDSS